MEPDEEIEMLLGEIPRATSAPPQFDSFPGAVQGSTPGKADFTDAVSGKKLPTSFSDSCVPNLHVSVSSENPNLNLNPRPSPNPSRSPSMLPRIPQALPQQQKHHHLQAFQGNRFHDDDESMVRAALANLRLQQTDSDSLHLLLDNRNAYNTSPSSILQDFSTLNSPVASMLNSSAVASMVSNPSVASMVNNHSVSSPQSSMLHSFGSYSQASLLDPSVAPSQASLLNHSASPRMNASPSSNIFCNGTPFPGGVEQTLTVRAENLVRQQGPDEHALASRAENLVRQHGFDWNPFLHTKGSNSPYFLPQHAPVVEYGDSPALPLAHLRQSASRTTRGVDLYGNGFIAGPQELQSDGHVVAYIQQQKLELARQAMEERLYLQHLHSALNASLHNQVEGPVRSKKYSTYIPAVTASGDLQYPAGSVFPAFQTALTRHGNYCRFYAQGHCSRGNTCSFLHPRIDGESGTAMSSLKESLAGAGLDERLGILPPNQFLQRRRVQSNGIYEDSHASSAGRRKKDALKAGHSVANGDTVLLLGEKASLNGLLVLDNDGTESLQQLMKFTNLDDLEGSIFSVAKDQHGCRFLQRKLDEAKPEDVEKIFQEIKDHIVELMTDPFGNYLVQKLLDVCNEAHCTAILEAVTKNDDLVDISLNMHGTRAVQKLIETFQTPEQISMAILSLKQGVVTLIKDLNGNHVVQRCLQRLSNEDSQFIFDAAASHCVEIASHRHGCCVLQRCVDFASGVQQQHLVAEIATNSLALSQDPFGNYVVQYILELGLPWASVEVISRLQGSYPHLAMQKFSSNVVEKCLKVATEENKSCIIRELKASSVLGQLLQDPYANYVIQSALQVTKGHLHMSLVDAIKPHVHVLRSSPYGKRILSRTQFKK